MNRLMIFCMLPLASLSLLAADKQVRSLASEIFLQISDSSLAPDGGRNYLAALSVLKTLPHDETYPQSLWLQANAPFNHHEILYPPPVPRVSDKFLAPVGYRPLDDKAMVALVRDRRLVMLNEAHHFPVHRLTAERFLRPLYQTGFRYLAAETFVKAELPQVSNWPTLAMGWYTEEPRFAAFVQAALAMGFELVAYEHMVGRGLAVREEGQANHLADFFASHPEGKLFVYAGYSHIRELPHRGREWMASRLKQKTGIDPLTINQTAVGAIEGLTEVSILMQGQQFSQPVKALGQFDVYLAYPPYGVMLDETLYGQLARVRVDYIVDTRALNPPIAVAVFDAAAYSALGSQAVPLDLKFIDSRARITQTSFLPAAEKYVLVYRDVKGELLLESSIQDAEK